MARLSPWLAAALGIYIEWNGWRTPKNPYHPAQQHLFNTLGSRM